MHTRYTFRSARLRKDARLRRGIPFLFDRQQRAQVECAKFRLPTSGRVLRTRRTTTSMMLKEKENGRPCFEGGPSFALSVQGFRTCA
ncbi:hypothetical protein V5799_027813 [Amblyomma americanum]|uniref:Uncharacterized protein n=1 Tax=Amblyomma americanum TaxID=6943 RepID=A0AAQ4DEN0_AMBAM